MATRFLLVCGWICSTIHALHFKETSVKGKQTSYGYDDNSPPSAEIAYPKSDGYPTVHDEATEGSGKYDDPITMATDKDEIAIGSIVYLCHLRKYLVMEDDCGDCDSDWEDDKKYHIDVWMGPQKSLPSNLLYACEDYVTIDNAGIIVNPANESLPVDTTPLIDPDTGNCSAVLYDKEC